MSILDSYSFQFANQAGWPAGSNGSWTHQRGIATQAIASNEGTLSGDVGIFNVFTYGSQAQNCVLQTRFIPGSLSDLNHVIFRYQSGGNYYYAGYGDGGQLLEIGVFTGVFNTLHSVAFTFVAGTAYQLKFQGQGNQLSVKAWQDGQAEPGWAFGITDSTIAAAGNYGVGAAVGSATAVQVDHFSASTIPGVASIFYSGNRKRGRVIV